jgi:hypothetical protein
MYLYNKKYEYAYELVLVLDEPPIDMGPIIMDQ